MSTENQTKKLFELIGKCRMCMLTTVDSEGHLRSRPMANQQDYPDQNLWFFTDKKSVKVSEIGYQPAVNLSYSDPDTNRYVSISGRAAVVKDKKLMKKFWNPVYQAWFPEGLADPSIILLKVKIDQAEYWDSPASFAVQLFGAAKALFTGRRYHPGGHTKIDSVVQ
jgi:general stress protein 26